ncbi:MAG: efflux RND transporter permease subunit [Proteobacteria bacterium]|nr:MAG: efflux RND transporter permease subunit [Pseudomonadota bacterium]
MRGLIGNPIRVYIVMALLAVLGVVASFRLPVSLFPNSLQPVVYVTVPYGSYSPDEFKRVYGDNLARELRGITGLGISVEKQETTYGTGQFRSVLTFNWGANADIVLRDARQSVSSITSTLPEESRRGVWVDSSGGGSHFAMAFYSSKRNLTELHKLLEPMIVPQAKNIKEAESVGLWNPNSREIKVELRPEVVAAIGVPPYTIESTIQDALKNQRAGSIENGGHNLPVSLKKRVNTLEDFRHIMIALPGGRHLPLGDIADIRFESNSQWEQSFKTSGVSSLILFASPKQGSNVKQMAESLLEIIEKAKASFPDDVEYRVLVDPSVYIRSAIRSVLFEVLVGSMLASLILFLFIGSLRNVVTTAIEIPISIALAFIMMWIFDININLLSLAGLALAAGMNVDASVVVMENIFRHFEEEKGELSVERKMQIILDAVDEVKLPVIASTLASLVVFLPFMFISGLSYAILGDLAKAVIFSHGFSAIVALILVPTVRFHIIKNEKHFHPPKAPIEGVLIRIEHFYIKVLSWIIENPKAIWTGLLGFAVVLTVAMILILPRLPKEIIGKPETDWLAINVETQNNTHIKQMETIVQQMDQVVTSELSNEVLYTFDEINGANQATILARIKDKKRMPEVRKLMESKFANSGSTKIMIDQWNPSEFRLPDPPQIRVAITGGTVEDRLIVSRDIKHIIEADKIYDQVWTKPDVDQNSSLEITPKIEQWNLLSQDGFSWSPELLTDAIRVATLGKWIGEIILDTDSVPIVMRYPEGTVSSVEDLGSFPLKVKGDLIPLRALADIQRQEGQKAFYVENDRELGLVFGKAPKEKITEQKLAATHKGIDRYIAEDLPKLNLGAVTVQVEDPQEELTTSMNHLTIAFFCSLLLIFLTMILQFGSVVEALLVLAAVPLGLVGALGRSLPGLRKATSQADPDHHADDDPRHATDRPWSRDRRARATASRNRRGWWTRVIDGLDLACRAGLSISLSDLGCETSESLRFASFSVGPLNEKTHHQSLPHRGFACSGRRD